MPIKRPPGKESSLFLDACAIINYVKPFILRKLVPGRPLPTRVEAVKDFIVKCNEKGVRPMSSDTAYNQARKYRLHFRTEFGQRFRPRAVDRAINATEHKIKAFFSKIQLQRNLSNLHFSRVERFFRQYETDPRMVELWRKKCIANGIKYPTAMPDRSDLEIFAQALTLKDLVFVTTDGHFGVLEEELEKEFGILLVTDVNAYNKMRQWGWLK